MNKQQLSQRIAELYNVPASIKPMRTHYMFDTVPVWLIDDTARMFELAVEHDIWICPFDNLKFVRVQQRGKIITFDENFDDHPTKLEATLDKAMKG